MSPPKQKQYIYIWAGDVFEDIFSLAVANFFLHRGVDWKQLKSLKQKKHAYVAEISEEPSKRGTNNFFSSSGKGS